MWVCPEHGRIGEVRAGNRCPECELTALDESDAANRDALDFARVASVQRGSRTWHGEVLAVLIVSLALVGAGVDRGILPWWSLAIVLAGILGVGILMWRAAQATTGWRSPGSTLRTLSSTMMLALAINLVFVVVKRDLGIEALWYAAGDPLSRLATATFTHGSAMHLIGNLIGAMAFGFVLDRRIGRPWMAVLLVVTALTAAIPQSLFSDNPMVGFSGCVFGLFGATLAIMPTRPQLLPIQTVAIPLPTWAWMIVVVTAFTVVDALDSSRHVAWVAHLGGFFGGLLVGLPMRAITPSQDFLDQEARRAATIASVARAAGASDLVPAAEAVEAASSNPEIAAFHAAARRRRRIVTLSGGGFLLATGATIAAFAAGVEADPAMAVRRVNVIIVSLVMAVLGLAMIGSQFTRKHR